MAGAPPGPRANDRAQSKMYCSTIYRQGEGTTRQSLQHFLCIICRVTSCGLVAQNPVWNGSKYLAQHLRCVHLASEDLLTDILELREVSGHKLLHTVLAKILGGEAEDVLQIQLLRVPLPPSQAGGGGGTGRVRPVHTENISGAWL